jgi:hypothetical protein
MSTLAVMQPAWLPVLFDRARTQGAWLICGLTAAALLALAAFLPLWTMTFHAPQYPQGLELQAYGTALQGDLDEVNALNHYVGVHPLEPDNIRELDLFPLAIAAVIAIVVAGALFARAWWLRAVVAAAAWLFLGGFLVDLQWWLYRAGHDLNPDAPFRVDDFTPRVLGVTKVVNFHSNGIAGPGLWLMLAAALLLTVGPPVLRFLYSSWQNTGEPQSSAGRHAPQNGH